MGGFYIAMTLVGFVGFYRWLTVQSLHHGIWIERENEHTPLGVVGGDLLEPQHTIRNNQMTGAVVKSIFTLLVHGPMNVPTVKARYTCSIRRGVRAPSRKAGGIRCHVQERPWIRNACVCRGCCLGGERIHTPQDFV